MQKALNINLNGISIYLLVIDPENESKYLKTLTKTEFSRYNTINNSGKKMEFAASRFLKHEIFGNEEIAYLEHGTPFINNSNHNHHISISHSKSLTGIAIGENFPIALDIEQVSDKSARLAPKFCNENEQSIFDSSSSDEMTLLWSFKETLYKLSDRNGLIFKTDLLVTTNENGYSGTVKMKEGTVQVQLAFTKVDDFYITCNQSYLLLQ